MNTTRTLLSLLALASLLAVAPQADAGSRWSPWQALRDGHKNGIDISFKPAQYGGRVFFALRNRYRGPVRLKITLTYVDDGVKKTYSHVSRLAAGSIRKRTGMNVLGQRFIRARVEELRFID